MTTGCSGDTEFLFGVSQSAAAERPLTEFFAGSVRSHVGRILRQSNKRGVAIRSLVRGNSDSTIPVRVDFRPETADGKAAITVSVVQVADDLADARRCDLVEASRGLSAASDADAIAACLARLTGADFCFFGRYTSPDETEIETVSVVIDGRIDANFKFDLHGTPCAEALRLGECCAFASHARECFPDSRLIHQLKVDAYIGAPLRDSSGKVVGLVAIGFRKSLDEITRPAALVELAGHKASLLLGNTVGLAESSLYRSLFNHSHDGVLVVDPESGGILEANDAIAELLGYRREEMLGLTLSDLDKVLFGETKLGDRVRRAGAKDGFASEGLYQRKDGGLCTVEITARQIDHTGRAYVIVGVRDASSSRHAEEALCESEQRFRALVENSSDVVTMLDADGRILYISPAVKHVFGHHPEDLLGESFFNRIAPNQREEFEQDFNRWVRQTGETHSKYFDWPDADRSTRHIAARIGNLLHDPSVQAMVVNMRDVTDRIQATAQMRRQTDLINQANEAICVWDLNGNVHSWNRGAEKLYGYSFPDVFGRSVREIGLIEPDMFQEAMETVKQRGSWSRDVSLVTRGGAEICVRSRWSLLCDENGDPEEILVIDSDISEQRRVENQLLRHQRMESIGTLASGIAHDLNNILMPILMLTTTLRRQTDNSDDAETLDLVIESAQRGADIVKQVLTYVRGAEGSRMLLQPQALLKELVRLVRETFPKSLQIKQQIPKDEWLIAGNMTELNQVLLNLAVNARDAMPKGGVLKLELGHVAIDQYFAEMKGAPRAGDYVMFRVGDSGSGIAPGHLERIFDPFFTTKPQGEGTGLGLATVKGIVESHDGFIEVQSVSGSGSEFLVYIPAVVDGCTDSRIVEPADFAEGGGQTILVVDDEMTIRKTLGRLLERTGYHVVVAQNGVEGIAKYTEQRDDIELIITDVTMPELDGIDFVKVIKNMDSEARVIVSSGRLEEDVAERFCELGVTEHLAKPYTSGELLATIRRVLNG